MPPRIERIGSVTDLHGEAASWHPREDALFWLDTQGHALHRLSWPERQLRTWRFDCRVAALAFCAGGGLLLVMQTGLAWFDYQQGKLHPCSDLEAGRADTQLNDARVDAHGRLIVGSMDQAVSQPIGSLYSVDGSFNARVIERGIIAINGPCWSPDERTFYLADSGLRAIFAYDYEPRTGELSNRRQFASLEAYQAFPDGATVDARGHLWSAAFMAGKLLCFKPDGSLERAVEVPTATPSSVAFGGPKLDVMFVTSIGREIFGRPPAPGDGGLYAIHGLEVSGRPENYFTLWM